MNNVMLDLETMGNGPNAAIVAIGAVAFDIETRELGATFYALIELESSVEYGGQVDAGTVMWWMKQSDVARAELCRSAEHIAVVLQRFNAWASTLCDDAETNLRVWGNGAAFDNVILASAYRRMRMPAPWKHWNDRCYRTVKALHRHVKLERTGTHHHALDDAISQAQHLIAMLNPLPADEESAADDLVSSQFLESFGVSLPVRIPASGHTTVVVEKYSLGRGVTIERESGNLAGREGALELEACGKFLSFNRLVCEQSDRRVLSVEYFVAAIRQELYAVGEEEHPELVRIAAAHAAGTPLKTAILQLPPATGKTTVAQELAQWLGCIHVLDEWCPDYPLVEGALHLTNAEVSA